MKCSTTEISHLCILKFLKQLENISLGNGMLDFLSAETYQMTDHVWILNTDSKHGIIMQQQ